MLYEIIEGWTSPIRIELKTRGAVPADTMAGLTPSLVLGNGQGPAIVIAAEVYDSAGWVIDVLPEATDFTVGVFTGRVRLTDSSGGVNYFPSQEPDTWEVRAVT